MNMTEKGKQSDKMEMLKRHRNNFSFVQMCLFGVLICATTSAVEGMSSASQSSFAPPDPKLTKTESMTGRRIFEFKSYRDSQLFQFTVPIDTKAATWKFNANFSDGCYPTPVSVYLEPGAYPVVSPDGGRFPEFMSTPRHAHNLTFRPENGRHTLLVTSPVPGEWYMLAYTNKQQKKDFVQQALESRCSTWLHTDVEYQLEANVIHLFPEKHNHQKLLLYHNIAAPHTYRFYTGKNVWSAFLNITKCRVKGGPEERARAAGGGRGSGSASASNSGSRNEEDESCPLRLSVAARRPPDVLDPKTRHHECTKDEDEQRSSGQDSCSMILYPEEESWHYITITPTRSDRIIEFAIGIILTDCPVPQEKVNYLLVNKIDPHQICSGVTKSPRSAVQLLFPPYTPEMEDPANRKCGTRIHLVRKTLPGAFTFEYQLPTPRNGSSPPPNLDLENDLPSVLQFTVGSSDIGGTLVVELAMNTGRLSNIAGEVMTIKACLSHGRRIIPNMEDGHPDRYKYIPDENRNSAGVKEKEEERLEAALCPGGRLLTLNVSAVERSPSFTRVLLPYPASGDWFLTLLPTCTKFDSRRMPPTNRQSMLYDSYYQKCIGNTTPIIFSIYSDMCVMGGCGKYGRCYQFFSGGNMFSTCSCFAGYKGWGCTDDTDATSEIDLLAATLLLCLSNLLFLPAVGLAIYRGFYTESFVYFANMVFSTLYHACDQDVFSFCLMKYTVLQFCDFYTATMSYWVTILAMGGLPDQAKSLLHMVGAVGMALAIEYDRTGVLTFLIPGVIGIFILIGSWVSHCSAERICYPGFKYTCCFFLPGVAVVCGGLFCFVFLEKESNYQFVHSTWHASMSVSILFLLPNTPAEKEEKYTILETRSPYPQPPPPQLESSFKHYIDGAENGPEIINMTGAGATVILPPDQVLDVTRRSSMAAVPNNKPQMAPQSSMNHTSTLPRSNMATRNYGHSHGTMIKKPTPSVPASGEELRPLTGNGGNNINSGDHHHVHHHHNPSSDTLRRVRFEKTGGTPESSNTPTSPISTCAKDDVTSNDVTSCIGEEGVAISGNGSVKNNVNSSQSTFKSPPHHVHSHPSSELEADTRM